MCVAAIECDPPSANECVAAAQGDGLARPPLQVPIATADPSACIKRVTDHVGHDNPVTVHTGSRHQALNADESLALLRSGHVMRLADSAFVAQLPAADSLWLWSPQKPAVAYAFVGKELRSYDMVAKNHAVIVNFSGIYERLLSETQLADPSSDGSKLVLGVQLLGVAGGGKSILQVNLENGSIISSTSIQPDEVGRYLSPRWVQMLPQGKGFLVAWPRTGLSRQAGIELHDAQGIFVRQVDSEGIAGDVAVTPDGTQWFVYTAPDPSGPGGQVIVKSSLTDAQGRPSSVSSQSLVRLDVSLQAQITCLARGQSFCVVATSKAPADIPHAGEIFRLHLDSRLSAPRLEPLLKHHSAPSGVYRHSEADCPLAPAVVLPHPSLDRSGHHVLFASNWGDHCFAELYMLRLP